MGKDDYIKGIEESVILYLDEVEKEANKIIQKNVRKSAKTLRENSPKDTGEYRSGYTSTLIDGVYYVYTKKKYQLLYLLEYGHLARDGVTRVNAQPHLYPERDKLYAKVEEEIDMLIRRYK